MIVYNVTCNVAPEVEKQWVEWVDLQLDQISKSERINNTSILKLNSNAPSEGAVYALQYQISDQQTLQNFLKNEDQILKEQIRLTFGEAVLHFSSQLEIIKQY
ncbi:MAG: DUF4286 family protein [Bacteroidetes bacterium]|jgi:hypothetical protein|nr:DUF4286 family protein [Flavobacteriaceae bacterium]MBT6127428.1 DUF4286 family protein [Flavobacteriaceae bacterium]MDG1028080.1 DUF4286 family protein [Flavobacteriaceae bacterium]MDG1941470.1 DUF4286 family protein [Flavobacteriaceae bacterium]NCF30772.1 DUF4286 family protein [Bacteroidota bacterium]|tara:strand:- start:477 stop:785 length:309 start_codon:yes stop_codon:yes gene_type:complete